MQCAWIIRIEIVDKVVPIQFLEFMFDGPETEIEIYRGKSVPRLWGAIEVRVFGDISSPVTVNVLCKKIWGG